MFKKLICKFIHKKHVYVFSSTHWEKVGNYRYKMHIQKCKNCGHTKRITV